MAGCGLRVADHCCRESAQGTSGNSGVWLSSNCHRDPNSITWFSSLFTACGRCWLTTFRHSRSLPSSQVKWHEHNCPVVRIITCVLLDLWRWNRSGFPKRRQPTSSTCRVKIQESRIILCQLFIHTKVIAHYRALTTLLYIKRFHPLHGPCDCDVD
jgi:hypothetical protein